MSDVSGNISLSPPLTEPLTVGQTKYLKYKYSNRLHYFRQRQDAVRNTIARLKKAIPKLEYKLERYKDRLQEYETYIINYEVETVPQVLNESAQRLQERLQMINEDALDNDNDAESIESNDDIQSVSTCDTELAEMRQTLGNMVGRRQ